MKPTCPTMANTHSQVDTTPADGLTLLDLPDELTLHIIRDVVKQEQPIRLYRDIMDFLWRTCEHRSAEVTSLLRPFGANKQLWEIAVDEMYRLNTSVQDVSPEDLLGPGEGEMCLPNDVQHVKHIEFAFPRRTTSTTGDTRSVSVTASTSFQSSAPDSVVLPADTQA